MKKLLLITSLILLSGSFLQSQTYFGFSYGYSTPIMKHLIASDFSTGSSGFALFKNMFGSFGGGNSIGGMVGYRFPSGFVCEVNVERFNANDLSYDFYDSTATPYVRHIHRDADLEGLKIIPQLGYAVGKNRISGWFKSGLIIGTNMVMTMNYSQEDGSKYYRNERYEGNLAIGFRQSAGISYELFKGLSMALEAFGNFQTWSPDKGEMTKNEYDGVDQLPFFSYSVKHFVFVDGYTEPNLNAQADEPREQLGNTYSLNGIGAKLSITYSIRFATKSGKVI